MLQFIQENGLTVVLVTVVLLSAALAVRKIVKDKKAGIGACGQPCSRCPHAGNCSQEKETLSDG